MLQQPKKSWYNNHDGFFLIHTLIALSIIIVSLTIISSYSTLWNQLHARAALETARTTLLYAQQHARTCNHEVVVEIDQKNRAFKSNTFIHTFPSNIIFGTLSGIKGPPSAPFKQINKPITFEQNHVIFYPDGTIQSGTLYLVDTTTQTQYALTIPIGHVRYIKLYQFTKQWVALS